MSLPYKYQHALQLCGLESQQFEGPLVAANSIGRRNTFIESSSRCLVYQGFPWTFIQLSCNPIELFLGVDG